MSAGIANGHLPVSSTGPGGLSSQAQQGVLLPPAAPSQSSDAPTLYAPGTQVIQEGLQGYPASAESTHTAVQVPAVQCHTPAQALPTQDDDLSLQPSLLPDPGMPPTPSSLGGWVPPTPLTPSMQDMQDMQPLHPSDPSANLPNDRAPASVQAPLQGVSVEGLQGGGQHPAGPSQQQQQGQAQGQGQEQAQEQGEGQRQEQAQSQGQQGQSTAAAPKLHPAGTVSQLEQQGQEHEQQQGIQGPSVEQQQGHGQGQQQGLQESGEEQGQLMTGLSLADSWDWDWDGIDPNFKPVSVWGHKGVCTMLE